MSISALGEEQFIKAGNIFESNTRRDARSIVSNDPTLLDYIHLEVPVNKATGKPEGNGISIRHLLGLETNPEMFAGSRHPRPDYIIKPSKPQDQSNNSWLIGDFKLSVKTMIDDYKKNGRKHDQWNAIVNHAKGYQVSPIAAFVTFYSGNSQENEKMRRGAFQRGIVAIILSMKEKRCLRSSL